MLRRDFLAAVGAVPLIGLPAISQASNLGVVDDAVYLSKKESITDVLERDKYPTRIFIALNLIREQRDIGDIADCEVFWIDKCNKTNILAAFHAMTEFLEKAPYESAELTVRMFHLFDIKCKFRCVMHHYP
jgi:hypothetical protein